MSTHDRWRRSISHFLFHSTKTSSRVVFGHRHQYRWWTSLKHPMHMVSIKSERHAIIALISIININVPAWCVCVCVCCILSICSLPNGLSILFQWKMVVQPLANMYRMAANLTYFLFHTQTHQCTSVSGHKCVSLLQIAISLSLVLFIPWFVIFFSLALFLFHLISRLVHFSHFDWPCVCVCVCRCRSYKYTVELVTSATFCTYPSRDAHTPSSSRHITVFGIYSSTIVPIRQANLIHRRQSLLVHSHKRLNKFYCVPFV